MIKKTVKGKNSKKSTRRSAVSSARTAKDRKAPEKRSNAARPPSGDAAGRIRTDHQAEHLASFPMLNPNAVIEVDRSGNITYVNPATVKILNSLGLTKEEAPVFLPDDIARILRNRKTLARSPLYREVAIKDRVFGEQISFTPDLSAARIYTHDVTERRQVEELLRRSEEKYRLLFENMAEGFALYELLYNDRGRAADWRVLEANEAYTRHTGVAREHVVGRRIGELFPEILPEHLPRFARVVATRTPEEFETRSKVSGRILRIITFPAGGSRFASTITDITARKQAEDDIKRNNAVLTGTRKIFESVLTCDTMEQLAETCLRVTEEITGSEFGFIGEIGADGLLHDIAVTDIGWEACSMYDKKGHRRPPGAFPIHGLYGRVLIGGKSFFTNDPAAHPDSVGTPEGHPLLKAFLGVPLISGGKTVGMIAAANRDGGYREEDRQALESMAPAILESLRHFRTGQAMRESEERLKRSQEIAQLGSWELDLVRNVLTWSDEVYRIFGLQPQEFEATYEAFLSAVHPDDRAAVDAAYSRSLREGKNSYEIEHRVVRRSTGEVRQVHEKCDHFRDASGRVIRSTGMVHDITERKRMEEELRRTSERYRSYIDVTGQLGWTTNADGEVVEDMPSWRAYTGQTAAEIMGWGWSKALHPDDARHTARVWSTAVAEHSAYEVEYRLRRHDGTYRHFLARGIPVISDSGAVREWVGTCIDITQRKQAEEALQQAHDELEQRVAQRTRFYNVRAQINEAATRSRDVQEYLDEVCRVMTETGGFKLAWVGIVDPQSRMVRPAASCGATGYLEGLTIMAADVPDGKGPTGRAITEGRHVINMDFETNEMMRPWRVRAREYGLRSSSAFPLRVHDETVGALMIYSSQPSFFTGEELSLLLNIADDISFALEAYDTGQKRLGAERELRKTAVELQDLYNNAPCGYHSLDKEGVIVRINDTELSWLGYSREEVVGKKKITDFFTPEGVRRFQERFQDFVRTGAVADLEFDLIRRDGSIMQGVLSSTAMYDGDGRYVMSRSMLYDITDRKKAEQQSLVTNALLSLYARKFDRKAYLSAAVELIRSWSRCRYIGIRVADDHGYIPYLSCVGFSDEFLASERTLSLDRDHCACTRVVLGTPEPQDLPAMTAAGSFYSNNTLRFVEGLTEEQKSRFRGVCVQSGFLSVAVVPIRYSDSVLGALHVADGREGMVPLAGVEFLEQAAFIIGEAVHRFGVEEERMRLASALESTADGVVITRPGNGTIEYVNRAFEQITGYSKDEAVGNTLHLLDSGRHNKAFFDELRSVLHRDGVWRGRLLNRKKDGTLYFEDCTFSPVRDQAGDILNYVSIKRDVTEKIRMESIAESVSMLDNIGAVFAGVRHEIGNPVNNVKMMLSVLKQKLDDLAPERVRHYTDRMLDEIKRVEHLLRTLKTFNLFETPEVEALDTTPLLDLFQGLVREDLEARGIALSVQILPGAERVRADGRAIQHVLLNLTTNAADALKGRDRPRIAITLSREDDEVHIRVSDNGAGMTEEQQKNLFKPFQTTKPKGTGLGLVIVKKMLTSINGRIAIDSKVGSGTIAHVYVPAEGPC